ncbi:SH3 domain-containing protein [Kaarinaea lacus]
MKIQRCVFFLALLLLHFSAIAEQVMYVQSAKANVMASPAFDSELLNVLKKGESVTVLKEQGRWSQVTYLESNGWVSKLLLASQPPMDKVSVLQGKEDQLENTARRRASTNVTAAATRGLRNDDRARMNDGGKTDYDELQEMEAVEIKEAEVRRFHEEGLGP